jgi:hypothetical protein
MDRRHYKILFGVGLVLGVLIVGATAVQLSSDEAGTVSDGVTYETPNGAEITIEGTTDVAMEDMFEGSDTLNLTTSDGIVTFSSTSDTAATIYANNITGTYTRVSQIDTSSSQLTINPEDKPSVTVGKNINRIEFTDMQIDDGVFDFIYEGPDGTTSLVTVRGLSANTQVRAVDANSGVVLDGGTTDGSGVVTFDNLDNSEHTVELQSSSGGPSLSNPQPNDETIRTETPELSVDLSDPDLPQDTITLEWYVNGNLENTTTVTSAGTKTAEVGPLSPDQVYDWEVVATDSTGNTDTVSASFELDHYDPEITDIQPQADLDSNPTQISAQINDSDFSVDGDSLTVDIILDGSVIDTQTITSNQEITTSMPSSGQTGGEHTIDIEATDSYSQTTTETQSYRVPDTLFVREENAPSESVAVSGEVRFFPGDSDEGDEVYSRSSSNGEIDMTGLPVDRDFIVEIEPTDTGNFTQRTIFIESIYEQETAYLLNTTKYQTVESRFVLNDPTGRFDSESVLKIQRPLEINGDLIYQTIVADRFGTEGVTATLEEDTRYQLRVSSDNFEQAVGPYRADTSETVEVTPGTTSINLEGAQTWAANAVIEDDNIEFAYDDPDQLTSKLVVYIYERGNKSNSPVANQTFMDIGEASGIVQVPQNQSDREWVVEFVVDRDNEDFTTREVLSNRKNLTPPIDPAWQGIIAVGALVLLAGAFSVLNAAVGAVIVSMFGGLLFFLGFLSGATSGIAVGIAIFVSVAGHIMSSTR